MIPDRLDKHEVFQFLRPDQVRAISDVAKVVEYLPFTRKARRRTTFMWSWMVRSLCGCPANPG